MSSRKAMSSRTMGSNPMAAGHPKPVSEFRFPTSV